MNIFENIEVEKINSIKLQQDDVLIIRLKEDVSDVEYRCMMEVLTKVFPNNQVVIGSNIEEIERWKRG